MRVNFSNRNLLGESAPSLKPPKSILKSSLLQGRCTQGFNAETCPLEVLCGCDQCGNQMSLEKCFQRVAFFAAPPHCTPTESKPRMQQQTGQQTNSADRTVLWVHLGLPDVVNSLVTQLKRSIARRKNCTGRNVERPGARREQTRQLLRRSLLPDRLG